MSCKEGRCGGTISPKASPYLGATSTLLPLPFHTLSTSAWFPPSPADPRPNRQTRSPDSLPGSPGSAHPVSPFSPPEELGSHPVSMMSYGSISFKSCGRLANPVQVRLFHSLEVPRLKYFPSVASLAARHPKEPCPDAGLRGRSTLKVAGVGAVKSYFTLNPTLLYICFLIISSVDIRGSLNGVWGLVQKRPTRHESWSPSRTLCGQTLDLAHQINNPIQVFICLGGQAQHEIQFYSNQPVSKAALQAVMSSSVTFLLMTSRSLWFRPGAKAAKFYEL